MARGFNIRGASFTALILDPIWAAKHPSFFLELTVHLHVMFSMSRITFSKQRVRRSALSRRPMPGKIFLNVD